MAVIREIVIDALLALATLTVVLSSIGVLVMPDAAARLHFVTPVTVVAPLLVALAVFVREGPDASTGMILIALVFMVAASPYLSHATIRAIRARETEDG
jgi:multisubunit Na+/H+ antiporter MnhG subunit